MEKTLHNLSQLNLTWHSYKRAKQRGIIPNWVHKSLADSFLIAKINQTQNKIIIEYGSLKKVILPDLKAYIRDNTNIVTIVKRKR